MPVRNTQDCNTTINPALVGQITDYMFCAGFSSGGHDACQVIIDLHINVLRYYTVYAFCLKQTRTRTRDNIRYCM